MLPATIGGYTVLRSLGHGATGQVFEAQDPVSAARVAIKRLSPELAGQAEPNQRFLREAEVAAGLRHPNIVAVSALGEDAGAPYLVMEFVPGADLADLIASGTLSIEWKLDILRQLCEGLQHAHAQGVIHRDVKPRNIRLTPDGTVKLLDFGMARVSQSSLTKRGVVMGSLHYMAPEQVEGGAVDARADVYSLGAVAYEMLAGKRPFDADSLSGLMLRITSQDADASALPRTPFSPGLEACVMRALSRELARRYASVAELREDLRRAVGAALASTAGI
jgi:serine/threonine-protein kinase